MKEGTHTYYTIQHSLKYVSKWRKLKEEDVLSDHDKRWVGSCFDYFNKALVPRKGREAKAVYPESAQEVHDVWIATGNKGWLTLRHAAEALDRVRQLDDEGYYDSYDPDRSKAKKNKMKIRRRNYRIVKLTVSKKTVIVVR